MLLAFCFYLLVLVGLFKLLERAYPLVDAPPPAVDALPPAYACAVCEAPTDRPTQRCLECGALPDETPSYRDGRLVITPRRMIADGRLVRLDPERTTAVTVAARALTSGATDGMGCSLLVAGTSALLAMLYPDGDFTASLVAVAVVALLAAPAFLLLSYTQPRELEYGVRLGTRDGAAVEVCASRDREFAATVAAQLRQTIAHAGALAAAR